MEIKRGIGKVMCSPELRKSYANEILTEVFKSISKWKFDKNSKKFFWISQYQVKFQSNEFSKSWGRLHMHASRVIWFNYSPATNSCFF